MENSAKRGPDFLEQEITERVRGGLLRWTMGVSVANPGDPRADPSKAWPEDRRAIEVDTPSVVDGVDLAGIGPGPQSCRLVTSGGLVFD
jgi:catalase